MRFKGILITAVVLLAVVFAVANWQTLTTFLPVNLLFFRIDIPVGFWLWFAALALGLLFFFLSIFERAGQLRHMTRLERQLDTLSGKLEKRRLDELAGLEAQLNTRFDRLGGQLEGVVATLQARMDEHEELLRGEVRDRSGKLEERVLLVRNELAADIAQVEDNLRSDLSPKVLGEGIT